MLSATDGCRVCDDSDSPLAPPTLSTRYPTYTSKAEWRERMDSIMNGSAYGAHQEFRIVSARSSGFVADGRAKGRRYGFKDKS